MRKQRSPNNRRNSGEIERALTRVKMDCSRPDAKSNTQGKFKVLCVTKEPAALQDMNILPPYDELHFRRPDLDQPEV